MAGGKTLSERIIRLEVYYVQVSDSLKDIKKQMETTNGTITSLVKFKIQAQAILGFMAFVVSVTAGTLLTLIVTEVL